jgi:hypothetical protein
VVARYHPLTTGGAGGTPDISIPFHDVHDPDKPFDTRVIEYVQGATLDVDFSVRNSGRWSVTIVGITSRDFGLFHVTEVRRGVLNRCCVNDEPFTPFALHPGEERLIELHGVMAGCRNVGGSVSWSEFRVRYRIVGITRSATIESNQEIEIHVPRDYHCTEPPARVVYPPRPSPRPTS